ncbi:F-box/LRR-repeat protein 15 [Manis javanica]|nr:F-box/LRR-repeat protein 15 [Manis javanica]
MPLPEGTTETRLRALEAVQKEVWASIKEAYQPEDLSVPHQFQEWQVIAVFLGCSSRSDCGEVFEECPRMTKLLPASPDGLQPPSPLA